MITGFAPRVHILGAAGAGMSGLGILLAEAGHDVDGCDLRPAAEPGFPVRIGHDPAHIAGVDLVLHSSSVPGDEPELAAARAAGSTVWERPDAVGTLGDALPTWAVAGSHGKTSSTAMLASVLDTAGFEPSWLVGARPVGRAPAHYGTGPLALEADEAFQTFRTLDPDTLLVTNITDDHAEHWGGRERMVAGFTQLARRTAGPVVACADADGAPALLEYGALGYGVAAGDVRVEHETRGDGSAVRLRGAVELDFQVGVPGRHFALNAAGVATLAARNGVPRESVAAGLAAYHGVHGRLEHVGTAAGVAAYWDYAVHPAEVAAVLDALRSRASSRVLAVLQPHRPSRVARLGRALGLALAAADVVWVTETYLSSEPIDAAGDATVVRRAAPGARAVRDTAAAVESVRTEVRPGDTVIFLGAGDIATAAAALLDLLRRGAA